MINKEKQREGILRRLHCVWSTGGGRLVSLFEQAARYHRTPLEKLTDDQLDAWLVREIKHIEDVCTGSCLNG